ncbi:MAG: hypothetical protein U5K43_06840 [Halofilum sp. (in: g-proteobacteria)]|nr:hypothetical protein [Halofilum sp. (in: g-proteobacteria)]
MNIRHSDPIARMSVNVHAAAQSAWRSSPVSNRRAPALELGPARAIASAVGAAGQLVARVHRPEGVLGARADGPEAAVLVDLAQRVDAEYAALVRHQRVDARGLVWRLLLLALLRVQEVVVLELGMQRAEGLEDGQPIAQIEPHAPVAHDAVDHQRVRGAAHDRDRAVAHRLDLVAVTIIGRRLLLFAEGGQRVRGDAGDPLLAHDDDGGHSISSLVVFAAWRPCRPDGSRRHRPTAETGLRSRLRSRSGSRRRRPAAEAGLRSRLLSRRT